MKELHNKLFITGALGTLFSLFLVTTLFLTGIKKNLYHQAKPLKNQMYTEEGVSSDDSIAEKEKAQSNDPYKASSSEEDDTGFLEVDDPDEDEDSDEKDFDEDVKDDDFDRDNPDEDEEDNSDYPDENAKDEEFDRDDPDEDD